MVGNINSENSKVEPIQITEKSLLLPFGFLYIV